MPGIDKPRPIEVQSHPPDYPLLTKYLEKILGHHPSKAELKNIATVRNIDESRRSRYDTYIPIAESIINKIQSLDHPKGFIYNLEKFGLVGTMDGVKISPVDKNLGRHVADAIILGNMELMLETAQELNIEIAIGKYSGDEDIFLLSPRNPNDFKKSRDILKTSFDKLLNLKKETYYSNPFFKAAKELISTIPSKKPNVMEEIGFKCDYADPTAVKIYEPRRYDPHNLDIVLSTTTSHAKTALGSIMDTATGKHTPSEENSISFLDYLKKSLKHDLNNPKNNPDLEGIYRKELNIKKIESLEKDIQKWQKSHPNQNLHIIRIGDTEIKEKNSKVGHTLGDHEMIGTASIVRRLASDIGLENKEIEIYQHNGSMIITCDQVTFEQLEIELSDPVGIYQRFEAMEKARPQKDGQDKKLRAHPFIVATTHIPDEKGKMIQAKIKPTDDSKKIWKIMDTLQMNQTINELLVHIQISGMVSALPSQLIHAIDDVLLDRQILPGSLDLEKAINLSYLESIFARGHILRPHRLAIAKEMLKSHQFKKIKNVVNHLLSSTQ